MASSKYSKYRKMLAGLSSDSSSKAKTTANNYKARLESGGVDVEHAMDKRNILERALNLEQDQNFIFDLFELLNRPQQALFNAWKSEQEGEDVLKGALEGLSGKEDVQFKEILKNYGMTDREGKIDLSDALGFAGDVLLDPMNLIPLAGFDEFGKALDAGASFRQASKNLKTGSDLAMSAIGKGVKGTAKLADLGIEKALTKADEVSGVLDDVGNVVKFTYDDTSVKNAADLVKRSAETGEVISPSAIGRLEDYKQIKNDLSRMFKVSDRYKNAILTKRGEELSEDLSRVKNAMFTDEMVKKVQDYATKYSDDVDKIANEITLFSEAHLDRWISDEKLVRLAKSGKLNASDEVVESLNRIIQRDIPEDIRASYDVAVKVSDQGKIELGKDILNGRFELRPMREEQLLKNQMKLEQAISSGDSRTANWLTKVIADNMTDYGYNYSKEDMKTLKGIINKYIKNVDYRNLMDDIVGTSWKGNTPLNLTGELNEVEKLLNRARKASTSSVIKPGMIDTLNSNIDNLMGTNLAGRYNAVDNYGYFPQTLTEEGKQVINAWNRYTGNKNPSIGSTALLSERSWLGSTAEKNRRFNELITSMDDEALQNYPELAEFISKDGKLFEENFFKAVNNRYLEPNGVSSVAKNANLANKTLAKSVFGDTQDMLKLKQQISNAETMGDVGKVTELSRELNKLSEKSGLVFLTDGQSIIPKGYSRVSKESIVSDLKKYRTLTHQVGLDSGLDSIIKSIEKYNGQIAMDKDILDLFHWASVRENYTGLSGLYNKYMNTFKKWKTVSPTFIINNVLGNSSNLALSGISVADQAKYGQTVLDIMQNGESYYMAKLSGKTLNASQDKIATLWATYRGMGFDQSALALQELPDSFKALFKQGKKLNKKEILTNGLPYINNIANIQMDKAARLTVMLKALDDPSYLNRLGVANVREAISRVMFDPDMLTSFERNKIKKFIPFYTYAKNNMMYHITNMGQNGKKYSQLIKSVKGLQDLATDGESESMSDFIKDNLYIPIPGMDKDGNYMVLRASLPFGQLLSTASNPLEELVSLATPAIKSPIELVLNKNTFSGSDIEKFKGEKSQNIPFLTKKQEKIIGDITGLDVPIKNISRIYQGISEGLNNNQDLFSSIGEGLRRTVVMDNNIENDKLFKTYDEINQLEDIMKQYKQKGYTFATITELKQANKNDKLLGIEAIFNKYGITNGNTKYDELRKLLNK